MKKLLTVIWFILAVLTMPVAMTAQGQSSGGEHTNVIVLNKKHNTQHPKKTGQVFMYAYYEEGVMEFELPADVSFMQLSIVDNMGAVIHTDTITPENPATEVYLSAGVYTIICTTDANTTFEGTLSIS